ncbi:hypothetical protein SCLCIDRAFT_7319 [Scleroderma citrinum Foug A]|uniref:Uncharacterized protein n=1 Tax=Scleroderma citrinum Foug A TaxID=1036808 RepID=A0A0C3EHC5_9AGAM|nr:hypothetical protein SCLCIDRAFT_7319 [Scleroderma citrinum Foug A]
MPLLSDAKEAPTVHNVGSASVVNPWLCDAGSPAGPVGQACLYLQFHDNGLWGIAHTQQLSHYPFEVTQNSGRERILSGPRPVLLWIVWVCISRVMVTQVCSGPRMFALIGRWPLLFDGGFVLEHRIESHVHMWFDPQRGAMLVPRWWIAHWQEKGQDYSKTTRRGAALLR